MTGAFVYLCLGFPLVRRHFLKQVISKGIHCCNFKHWWRFSSCSCCHHSCGAVAIHRAASSCVLRFFGLSAGHHGWSADCFPHLPWGRSPEEFRLPTFPDELPRSLLPQTFPVALISPGFFLQITGTLEFRLAVVRNVLLSLPPTGFRYL